MYSVTSACFLQAAFGKGTALLASYVRSPASLSPEGGQKGMNGTQEVFNQERHEDRRQDKRMDRDRRR